MDETRINEAIDDNTKWLPTDLLEELTTPTTPSGDPTDATQRVYLDTDIPLSKTASTNAEELRANIHARSEERRLAALREKKRKQRILLISVCAAAGVVLLGIILLLVALAGNKKGNGDTIADNIYAAGVALGGMNEEEAKAALHKATDDTYSQVDMQISVLNTNITLSPKDSGATLDVDAVVAAALAVEDTPDSAYTLSIIPYLNLNTAYIQSVVNEVGDRYNTTLTQTTYTVEGTRPNMNQEEYDTSKVYQQLIIHLGNAEYGLNTNDLYQQILDAYEINLFEVTCTCSVVPPDALDYDAIWNELCVAAANAQIDMSTYEITPEIYGYGFTLDELTLAVNSAEYGSTITLDLRFIKPDITSEYFSDELFQNTLVSYTSSIPSTTGWKENLTIICDKLNGFILKNGEEFSFNTVIGQPTEEDGYQIVPIYQGKSYQEVIGGGASHVASALYYCALSTEMNISERHNHSYPVTFIQNGFDAEIIYDSQDLRFTNNSGNDIMIQVSISGNSLTVEFLGAETRSYYVRLSYETDQTLKYQTVYNTMLADNAAGYKEGQIISSGANGCVISTYITKYDTSSNRQISQTQISQDTYDKRDQVVVTIYQPETEPDDLPTETPTEAPTGFPEDTTDPTPEQGISDISDPT